MTVPPWRLYTIYTVMQIITSDSGCPAGAGASRLGRTHGDAVRSREGTW